MEVFARLIELKPGGAERVQAWAEHIDAHRANAVAAKSASSGVVQRVERTSAVGGGRARDSDSGTATVRAPALTPHYDRRTLQS
jgi:hypothetical protein